MNSLNLRVSSVKTGENIRKNAELRTSRIILPSDYLILHSNKVCMKHFLNADTVPDQVNAVKFIYVNMNDKDSLEFLTDLYFVGPLKHPVRNQVAKLLQSCESSSESHIKAALNAAIHKLLEKTTTSSSCYDLNKVITSLSGCFENFGIALQSLQQNVEIIFTFLEEALQRYMQEASLQSSRSAKNEIYLFIHNLIRFVLACIQEFISSFSDAVKAVIDNMTNPARELILNPDMPMDVKTNCGNLIAYTAKINDKYIDHIKDVTQQNLQKENNCYALCCCIGVINTISCDEFTANSDNIAKIISQIYNIANKYTSEPAMLLAASRILFQISKLLLLYELFNCDKSSVKCIQKRLTNFVLSYLEHHIDSVRHICKDLIRNIIKLNDKLTFCDLQNEIFEFCNQNDTPQSLRSSVLIAISNTIGTQVILKRFPALVNELLASGLASDLSISNCYENLMIGNHKEIDLDKWVEVWIMPLISLGSRDKNVLGHVEILINKAVKCDSRIVDILINMDNKDISLSTRLSALWTVRKNGLQTKNFQLVLEKFSSILKDLMISSADDTKIMALRLVVESHKTTEPLSNAECDILLEFLKYNSNCQSPAIRQRSLALISKGLVRLQVCFEKAQKGKLERVDFYREFLRKLIKLLADNLFIGANFSRRSVSLALLEQSVKLILECKEDINEFVPEYVTEKLIDALNDSYESNKAIAVSILQLIGNTGSQRITLETIKDLMTSVRPTDSLTAAYYLEFYCFHAKSSDFGYLKEAQDIENIVQLAAISWCEQILEDGIKCGIGSILLAARKNPLYGCVVTIRHLLAKTDFKLLAKHDEWRLAFTQIIKLCKSLTDIVGPIVNSDSPEGHLPNDFNEIPEFFGKPGDLEVQSERPCKILSSKQDMRTEILKTTPQMVLLCGWRTIKEVSLLLGEIVLKSPIRRDLDCTDNYLITVEQIINIGEHFKKLLSETKHRGAFEQAYVGFCKICARLWRTEHPDLYKLPMQWLNELIEIISKDEKLNEKICATRRSAGIPFMVQALITSELQVGTTKALTCCMKQLISLCSDNSKSTESRTHALNILRALFRCSDLNEVVGEYIADGVMCSIRGYSANTWAEKNSSTLLFSALITRIFGVQRTKEWENLTIRNRMTGRIFFLRYPQLYDFFLGELKEASLSIQRNERPAKLHPLLLILSRLYPSALEGTESNLKVCAFIDIISTCSGSAEMTTRILTARAIVAFMTQDMVENRILEVFQQIQMDLAEKHNQNYVHGLLLQILFLVKGYKNLPVNYLEKIIQNIEAICEFLKPNPVTWKVCLDIGLEIFKRTESSTPLLYICSKKVAMKLPLIYQHEFSRLYPVFRKTLFLYNLYLMKLSSWREVLNFLASCFEAGESMSYEEIETCLNVVILILFHSNAEDVMVTYEILDTEIDFVNSISEKEIKDLRSELISNKSIRKFLNVVSVDRRFYPECAAKAYAALSQLPDVNINFIEFITTAKQQPDDVKDSMAKCLESYVQEHTLSREEFKLCLEFLENLSLPWNSDLLRLTAAKIVHNITIDAFTRLSELNSDDLVKLINIVLCLSRDDDFDVRDSICKTVVTLSNSTNLCAIGNISASYAPIALTRYLGSILKKMDDPNFTKNLIEGVVVAQMNELTSIQQDDDGEGEVFDKNEANVFAEPFRTLVDCIETFSECFEDNEIIRVLINSLRRKTNEFR